MDRVDDALAALGSLVKWVREDDERASRQRQTASFLFEGIRRNLGKPNFQGLEGDPVRWSC